MQTDYAGRSTKIGSGRFGGTIIRLASLVLAGAALLAILPPAGAGLRPRAAIRVGSGEGCAAAA